MDKATTSSIDTISRTCIAVRLRLLNRVVTNLYDDALRPLGLIEQEVMGLVARILGGGQCPESQPTETPGRNAPQRSEGNK